MISETNCYPASPDAGLDWPTNREGIVSLLLGNRLSARAAGAYRAQGRGWYRFVCYYGDVPRLYDAFECVACVDGDTDEGVGVACVDGDADGGDVYGDDGETSSCEDGGVYEDDVWMGYDNDGDDGGDDGGDDWGACFCHHVDGDDVEDNDNDNGDDVGGDDGDDEYNCGGRGDGDYGGKSYVPAFSWGQSLLF